MTKIFTNNGSSHVSYGTVDQRTEKYKRIAAFNARFESDLGDAWHVVWQHVETCCTCDGFTESIVHCKRSGSLRLRAGHKETTEP